MGFALTPGEAPLHFSRSKNMMHVALFKPSDMINNMMEEVLHNNDARIVVV